MATDDEARRFGPRPELLGRSVLQVHDVHRGAEQNAGDTIALGHAPGVSVEGCCDGFECSGSLLSRQMRKKCFGEESARPPEFLHREVGGTHVFIGHSALAIVKGERVWAVTASGVEALL